MSNRKTNILAALMLAIMLALAFFAMTSDSQTMDEVSHLPAGYSYISQKDMRINPEHPPLVKDLSGLSVWLWSEISGNQINFPSEINAWKTDINGQWDYGFKFMYGSGNDADKMLFFGRLPMLLILLLLGFYVFKWAKELFGNNAALLAVFLFSFSPTFIAHGHLVTTDVAASAAIFISIYYFVRWLKNTNYKNLVVAGIVLGIALLAKFSTFLLFPLFGFMVLVWMIVRKKEGWIILSRYLGGFVLITIISILVLYPVYLFHVWNYPVAHQINDINFVLNPSASGTYSTAFAACTKLSPIPCAAEITVWMASKSALRPWAQYAFGFLMVVQRATGGNTTYFLGEVSNSGWKDYFPIVYAIKEPLAMHILTIFALLTALISIIKAGVRNFFARFKDWLENHMAEFGMLGFIAIYWASSLSSNLNIGVRHLLPTFPLVYVLVSGQISKWFKPQNHAEQNAELRGETHFATPNKIGCVLIFILIAWQIISVVSVCPNFLTYFNELVGGPANAYKYVVDSNLDWGQDMKRLAKWTNENNVKIIYVDYFGGTDPVYYLKDKFRQWHSNYNPDQMIPNSYLAVSATFLQNDLGQRAGALSNQPGGFYSWLKQYQPVIVIGNSIFVYHIP